MKARLLFMAITVLAAGAASAHPKHCRIGNGEGSYTDAPSLKTKDDCEAKSGKWTRHSAHCTAEGADGGLIEYPKLKNQAACEKNGHAWDHQTPLPAPATSTNTK